MQYECFSAPLKFNGIKYAWWNDRQGNEQYFWAGENPVDLTCQCAIDGKCFDPNVSCNCDAHEPQILMDTGWFSPLKRNLHNYLMSI